ncbi:MAG: GGDEF domain-containing protein [Pseudomonadota bacterium]
MKETLQQTLIAFIDWFLPTGSGDNPSELLPKRFLVINTMIAPIIGFVGAALAFFSHPALFEPALLFGIMCLVFMLCTFLHKWTGWTEVFSVVSGALFFTLVCYLVFTYGGGESPALPWFVCLLLFCLFFEQVWMRVLSVTFVVIALVSLFVLDLQGYHFDHSIPDQVLRLTGLLSTLFASAYAVTIVYGLFRMYSAIERRLSRQVRYDHLTGARNRGDFMREARHQFLSTRKYDRRLCVLMVDLDHFKSINDNYGHPVGDKVLAGASKICRRALRDADFFGRVGGEEFAAVLPGTGIEEAALVAERIRSEIEESRYAIDNGDLLKVTISIGIAQREPEDDSFEMLLKRADEWLYTAKTSGRNQVAYAKNTLRDSNVFTI